MEGILLNNCTIPWICLWPCLWHIGSPQLSEKWTISANLLSKAFGWRGRPIEWAVNSRILEEWQIPSFFPFPGYFFIWTQLYSLCQERERHIQRLFCKWGCCFLAMGQMSVRIKTSSIWSCELVFCTSQALCKVALVNSITTMTAKQ